jgi:saccharopine dehydrogenase (NAD+, L-lysine-forming)
MAKVTVLGGSGSVGSVAAKIVASSGVFSDVVIADINLEEAKKVAGEIGGGNVSAVRFDANSAESTKSAVKGSSVVLNCVGPFYRFGPPIMKAVISCGINYVDICDDFDATEKLLDMDKEAKKAGVLALIGMGSSPGLANVLVRYCAESLLDEMESVDIYHAHGGEETEGAAVVKHRIHSMKIDIPMFLDGKFTTVRVLEDSGKALEEVAEFQDVGTYNVYAYPHPETITLPKFFKGVKRVTNLGTVLPPGYAELIKGVVKSGITMEKAIEVGGQMVVPLEFAVAFILSQRGKIMQEAGLTGPVGCLKIVVKGYNDGQKNTYIFSTSSKKKGMGEGTGIPAALGAMLMGTGKLKEKGVLPPEGCVNPMDMIELLQTKVKTTGAMGGASLTMEHIDQSGKSEKVDLLTMMRKK